MSAHGEKLKEQLLEIADVVNTFESDSKQIRIIEKFVLRLERLNRKGKESVYTDPTSTAKAILYPKQTTRPDKPPGITRIINLLLTTDFFDSERSISEITDYANDHFKGPFYTNSTSGILLKLVKQQKLDRVTNKENKRFVYIKRTIQ